MEKQKDWDDTPSLEGFDVDWTYKPENPLGKRSYVRMKAGDITAIFEVKKILVRVATEQETYNGYLLSNPAPAFTLSRILDAVRPPSTIIS